MSSVRQQVLLQTLATRQNAEKLLASLLRAQAECDQQLQKEQRSDAMKSVTGASSLDRAIASTRRMIEQLDRSVEQVAKDLPCDDAPAASVAAGIDGVPSNYNLRVVVATARAAAR